MSGLIYGAIVVMWVAFLVPMWLRRHDEAVEAKSVDRFSRAMKVLARRTTAPDIGPSVSASEAAPTGSSRVTAVRQVAVARFRSARELVAQRIRRPAKESSPHASHGATGEQSPATAGSSASAASRPTRRPASAAVRRQRVLAILTGLTVVAVVLAATGVLPWLAVALPTVLLIGYLVALRLMAKQAGAGAGSGRSVASTASTVITLTPQATQAGDSDSHGVRVSSGTARRAAVPTAATGTDDSDYTVIVSPSRTPSAASTTQHSTGSGAIGSTMALGSETSQLGGPAPDGFSGPRLGWDPVPVPSPSYVNAPRAPRVVRSIDLSANGAWTSGRLVADAKAAAAAAVNRPMLNDPASQGLPRRAVND